MLDYADKAKDANGDEAELAQLAKDDSEKMTTAMAAITKQAWDTCKVNLHYS